jgi:hypothetical protein
MDGRVNDVYPAAARDGSSAPRRRACAAVEGADDYNPASNERLAPRVLFVGWQACSRPRADIDPALPGVYECLAII